MRGANVDARVDRAARLVVVNGEIEMCDLLESKPRKYRVAEVRSATLVERSRRDVIAGRAFQISQKIFVRLLRRDFLQRDDAGVDFGKHVDDARRRVPSVGPD